MLPIQIIENLNGNLEFEGASGIYMIFCMNSGKAYIGRSRSILKRWYEHSTKLKNNKHRNPYLQNIYNKYGKEGFKFLVVENCSDKLAEREEYWASQIDETYRINLAPISEEVPITEELRKKFSEAQKRSYAKGDRKTTKGRIPWNKGKSMSEELKEKYKLAGNQFKKGNEPWNKGDGSYMTGENNHFYGKTHSEETRKKISEAKKLNPQSKEKNPFYGKKHSEETRKKMSEAAKRRWEKN